MQSTSLPVAEAFPSTIGAVFSYPVGSISIYIRHKVRFSLAFDFTNFGYFTNFKLLN
jgi:hypothetical protein